MSPYFLAHFPRASCILGFNWGPLPTIGQAQGPKIKIEPFELQALRERESHLKCKHYELNKLNWNNQGTRLNIKDTFWNVSFVSLEKQIQNQSYNGCYEVKCPGGHPEFRARMLSDSLWSELNLKAKFHKFQPLLWSIVLHKIDKNLVLIRHLTFIALLCCTGSDQIHGHFSALFAFWVNTFKLEFKFCVIHHCWECVNLNGLGSSTAYLNKLKDSLKALQEHFRALFVLILVNTFIMFLHCFSNFSKFSNHLQ